MNADLFVHFLGLPFRWWVDGTELADAALRAYDVGEREGVPVLVGVGWVLVCGFQGGPVAAVVRGDVGAVGAYGDPEFLVGVVGYRTAVAVGWRLGSEDFLRDKVEVKYALLVKGKKDRRTKCIGALIVTSNGH